MSDLLSEIITSNPDAKPLSESMSARWVLVMAVGWAAQNIVAWLSLDQSATATVATGLLGFLSFIGALVGIMRRNGIRVPGWLIELLEAIEEKKAT